MGGELRQARAIRSTPGSRAEIAPPHAPSSRLTEVAVRHRDRSFCHFIQFPILVCRRAHPGTSLFAARRSPCVRKLRGARTRLLDRLLHPSPASPRHRSVGRVEKPAQTLTVLHNGVRPRCGAGWQPARRLVTAAGPLRARQWAGPRGHPQSAAAYQAAPQCQICRSAWALRFS